MSFGHFMAIEGTSALIEGKRDGKRECAVKNEMVSRVLHRYYKAYQSPPVESEKKRAPRRPVLRPDGLPEYSTCLDGGVRSARAV
jgi:hypothetical protein